MENVLKNKSFYSPGNKNTGMKPTPAGDGDLQQVAADLINALGVHVQAEVKGVHSEPGEGGQQEVVHGSPHNLTSHRVLQRGHKVVDQEAQVQQEHGRHQVHQKLCGGIGFCPPVRRNKRQKLFCYLSHSCLLTSAQVWPRIQILYLA